MSVARATPAHIARIASLAREADRRELWAGWRHTPEESLRFGLKHSSHVWTGLVDFQAICMFGVVPTSILAGTGNIWLIGTDDILEHQVAFLRRCKPFMEKMRSVYKNLSNYVAAENTAAVHWLEWLDFTMSEPKAFGADGMLFRKFEWRRDHV